MSGTEECMRKENKKAFVSNAGSGSPLREGLCASTVW